MNKDNLNPDKKAYFIIHQIKLMRMPNIACFNQEEKV